MSRELAAVDRDQLGCVQMVDDTSWRISLEGKRATCYPGFEDKLTGAEVIYDEVAEAGNIITSRGMGTTIHFALRITAYLIDEDKAQELAKKIIYCQ